MPNYRTHSIHGELILPQVRQMNRYANIEKEDFKTFCIGPDALIFRDYKTFSYQHANKTRDYFLSLINYIKEHGLQDNGEVMAFLYGHLDHFSLDTTMHPLINYMTSDMEAKYLMKPHGTIETWIDDYVKQKYNSNEVLYYHKWFIKSEDLKRVINEVYSEVYGKDKEVVNYNIGNVGIVAYDTLGRANTILIAPLLFRLVNLGALEYKKDYSRVLPYLNLENDIWYNPITGEEHTESFDDLWNKSMEISLETIDDVNKCLYQGKPITNPLIMNNISFSTGEPCELGKSYTFVKKY